MADEPMRSWPIGGVSRLHGEIDRLRALLLAAGIQPDEASRCEHGVDEWEYCEPCNREYKRARKDNGFDDDASI